MNFFVKPFNYSSQDRDRRDEAWKSYLENYVQFSSMTQIPFSYAELMNMPVKMIIEVFQLVQKEADRKAKAMREAR